MKEAEFAERLCGELNGELAPYYYACERGASLLYQVIVDTEGKFWPQIPAASRGQFAF